MSPGACCLASPRHSGVDIAIAQQFRATNNRKSPRHSEPNAKRKSRLLTDEHVEALREFADVDANLLGYYPDSKVFGLSIFPGAKSSV
jgi:hypothetical protein